MRPPVPSSLRVLRYGGEESPEHALARSKRVCISATNSLPAAKRARTDALLPSPATTPEPSSSDVESVDSTEVKARFTKGAGSVTRQHRIRQVLIQRWIDRPCYFDRLFAVAHDARNDCVYVVPGARQPQISDDSADRIPIWRLRLDSMRWEEIAVR